MTMNQTPIEQLSNPDGNIRGRAALNLSSDVRATGAMLNALAIETDILAREDITWALVRMGDVALLPLLHMLYDDRPTARHHAAHTLGKIGDARAVSSLIYRLLDSDPAVVLKSALALGQIGDTRAIPALVNLLGSENFEIQSMLMNVLDEFGDAALGALIQALSHQRWQVREQAAEILGEMRKREAEDALIGALGDATWQVRFAAVNALGQLRSKNLKTALQPLENDPDERVRGLVAKMLKRVKG